MRAAVSLAALLTLLAPGTAAQMQQAEQPLKVAALITHASGWADRFNQSLSGLLFRERFVQRLVAPGGGVPLGMTAAQLGRGTLRTQPGAQQLLEANIFLLRPSGSHSFIAYRDVYRLNSRDLTDHTERLQKLLVEQPGEAHKLARALTDASARHNLPGIHRNINLPTMAYEYLEEGRQLRVREVGRETLAGLDLVIVEFEELQTPAVVRGARGEDIFATGRFWIHPESGAVPRVIVEFDLHDRTAGRLEVVLQLHETLQVWVPKEMTEVWSAPGRSITGLAEYDRFQRLNVATAEIIK